MLDNAHGGHGRGCRVAGRWTLRDACPSTSATSFAVWNRSAGFFACSFAMMSHSQSGTSLLISRMGRVRRIDDALDTAWVPPRENIKRPVHIVYSTVPRLNRSER